MQSRFFAARPLSGIFAPLSSTDFRRLVSADLLWWFTILMEFVAFGWIALELTDSVWMVSISGFFRSLPLLLFGPFGGGFANRFGRRPVIITCQSISMSVYLALAILQVSGNLVYWHLLAAGFVLGTVWSVDFPSRRALLPDLVGKAHSVDAMMLENLAMGGARILGPWTAGVLLAATGPAGCFAAMALAGLASLIILRQLTKTPVPRTTRSSASLCPQ